MQMCPRCSAAKAIGSERARPDVRRGAAEFPRRLSVESPMGGYGLYYRSPLIDLDVVIPAGAMLGETATRVDVLARSDHAIALATAFGDAIEGTQYARRYMNGVDPIPASVLTELAEHACLCQLDQHPVERDAIRAAYFEQTRAERAAEVEQRRRAFAFFLSQLDNDPAVSEDDSAFRRGTIDAFHHDPGGNGSYVEAQASWGALAMKECVQDAICSLWTEFCRRGLEVQEPDGMTRTQLHQFIFDVLAAPGQFELAGSTITWQPEQPLNGLRDATLAAASAMHWEDARRWTEQLNTAMSGLAALLWFEAHTPDPGTVLPAWRWVASQDSDHQSGYLRTILAVRGELRTEPSVAEALGWALREFVIGPHEVIAYSKLPESTFRFCWEEGRLRFYPTGHDRFTASGARRNALSSLTEDLGLWSRAGATNTPHLTDAGRAFLTRVFG